MKTVLRNPEAERKTRERQPELIEPIGQQYSAAEGNAGPDQQQADHDADIGAPVPLERGMHLRVM